MEYSISGNQWYWSKRNSDERKGPVGRERLEGRAEEGALEPEDLIQEELEESATTAGTGAA
jgi:hypothetical protein